MKAWAVILFVPDWLIFRSDELPKFHFWLWNTITGVTGVLATVIVFIIYTFAVKYARQYAYKVFWITHQLYIVMFILLFLHGAGRLVQVSLLFFDFYYNYKEIVFDTYMYLWLLLADESSNQLFLQDFQQWFYLVNFTLV